MQVELPLAIDRQPDYTTCGPTSLHAVYRFLGDDISLSQVIAQTPKNPGGGTLNVHLAVHALRRGYKCLNEIVEIRRARAGNRRHRVHL